MINNDCCSEKRCAGVVREECAAAIPYSEGNGLNGDQDNWLADTKESGKNCTGKNFAVMVACLAEHKRCIMGEQLSLCRSSCMGK